MAVFTPITHDQLAAFLENYSLGALESFAGISSGTQNTNYHVRTTGGRYVLTIFEPWANHAALPFVFDFTRHVADAGINCPRAMADAQGRIFGEIAGRRAALITCLEGRSLPAGDISPDACAQVGALVARLHIAARDFPQAQPNYMGLPVWREIAARCIPRADEVEPGLAGLIAAELEAIGRGWPRDGLPRAVVHTDIFPDNVFFRDGRLDGLIDFYFACTDFLAYDLMMTVNAWCFDEAHAFAPARYDALMAAYEEKRPLEAAERAMLPLMGRAAALRILLTRLNDWLFHNPDDMVTPHDPRAYSARLRFHREREVS